MLVFGPYHALPKDEGFIVFNLSSPVESISKLPGLFVVPEVPIENIVSDCTAEYEKSFDRWYYDYVLNDMTACNSLMTILTALYESGRVYICIANYDAGIIPILNESFMKLIQVRYDIKYSVVNTLEDFLYIPHDGCDFGSVNGIQTFDADKRRYLELSTIQSIQSGGITPYADPY